MNLDRRSKPRTYWQYLAAIAVLIAVSQTMAYNDAIIANGDPIPEAHGGLGCITDSECELGVVDESIDDEALRAADNLPLSINEGE